MVKGECYKFTEGNTEISFITTGNCTFKIA